MTPKNTYYGEFKKQDQKEGTCFLLSNDGSYFYGQLVNNKRDGLGVTVDAKEYTRYGMFRQGKLEGEVFQGLVNDHFTKAKYVAGFQKEILVSNCDGSDKDLIRAIEAIRLAKTNRTQTLAAKTQFEGRID